MKVKATPDTPLKSTVDAREQKKIEQKVEVKQNMTQLRRNLQTKTYKATVSKPAKQPPAPQRELFEPTTDLYEVEPELDTEVSEQEVEEFLLQIHKKQQEAAKKASSLQVAPAPSPQVSALQSQLKMKSQLVLPGPMRSDPERTLSLIEQNEAKKIDQQAKRDSQYYGQAPAPEPEEQDFSEINELLNTIRRRIIFHLELGRCLKRLVRSVYIHGLTYTLVFHCKNLVNQALQILSGEQAAARCFPDNWEQFMDSHDHSIQTNNFVLLSDKVYQLLYHSYEKLHFLTDPSCQNAALREVGQLIVHPDDENEDIGRALELMLVAACGSLDKRANAKSKKLKISTEDSYRTQVKIGLVLLMNALGVFVDKEVYELYRVDELCAELDRVQGEQNLLNLLLRINNDLRELDR